jgi:hypothetical protein
MVSSNGVSRVCRVMSRQLLTLITFQVLALSGDLTNQWSNLGLPQASSYIMTTGVFPYWDDLFIYNGTAQGIYYQSSGTNGSRTATFEFYESAYQQYSNYYHFQLLFYENAPNTFTLKYYNITDLGASATVGYQCNTLSEYKQYSYNQTDINPGLAVSYNNNTDAFTTGTFASRTFASMVGGFMSRVAGKISNAWRVFFPSSTSSGADFSMSTENDAGLVSNKLKTTPSGNTIGVPASKTGPLNNRELPGWKVRPTTTSKAKRPPVQTHESPPVKRAPHIVKSQSDGWLEIHYNLTDTY